jgi:hypothetical protein
MVMPTGWRLIPDPPDLARVSRLFVAAIDRHVHPIGRTDHPDEPGIATDLAVLHEAAAHVFFEEDLDLFAAEGTQDGNGLHTLIHTSFGAASYATILSRDGSGGTMIVLRTLEERPRLPVASGEETDA